MKKKHDTPDDHIFSLIDTQIDLLRFHIQPLNPQLWCVQRGLCVCVCGIEIGIKHINPCRIYTAEFTVFYTNLNPADAKFR